MSDIAYTATGESGGFLSQVGDFAAGVVHSALENPVNAVVQIVNHASGVDIPELDIVDDTYANRSTGGQIGQVVGGALDFIALSYITGGLVDKIGIGGVKGIGGAALKMGIAGTIYEGVLKPSDKGVKNFWADRAGNAAVGFGTFAAMGALGPMVDATGMFAVPAARSFAGSLAYGGITGAGAGAVYSELNAVIKDGKIVPTFEQFATDTLTFAGFGAAMGGMENVVNRFTLPKPLRVESGNASVTVQTDRAGNPVRVNQVAPDGINAANAEAVKMTDGRWANNQGFLVNAPGAGTLKEIQISPGSVTTLDTFGNHRYYRQGAAFDSDRLREAAQRAAGTAAASKPAEAVAPQPAPPLSSEAQTDGGQQTKIDDGLPRSENRVTSLDDKEPKVWRKQISSNVVQIEPKEGPDIVSRTGWVRTDDSGAIIEANFGKYAGSVKVSQNADGTFQIRRDDSVFNLDGKVRFFQPDAFHAVERIEFTPKNGDAMVFPITSNVNEVLDAVKPFVKPLLGATGKSFVTVSPEGKVMVTGGKGGELKVNGNTVQQGQSVELEMGDKVHLRRNISIDWPDWKEMSDELILKGKARELYFRNHRLVPNTGFDIDPNFENPGTTDYIRRLHRENFQLESQIG